MRLRYVLDRCTKGDLRSEKIFGVRYSTELWVKEFLQKITSGDAVLLSKAETDGLSQTNREDTAE
jgi:hypothetical protein